MRHHTGSGRPHQALDTEAWNAAGAAAIDATLPGTVTVGPPGSAPTWNRETRQTETTPAAAVYAAGPAEITADEPSPVADAVDEQVAQRTYTVRLSLAHTGAHAVRAGHVVTVVADPDPALTGAQLHVESARYGSRGFSRLLTCTLT